MKRGFRKEDWNEVAGDPADGLLVQVRLAHHCHENSHEPTAPGHVESAGGFLWHEPELEPPRLAVLLLLVAHPVPLKFKLQTELIFNGKLLENFELCTWFLMEIEIVNN